MSNELYASDLAACPSVYCATRDDYAPRFSGDAVIEGQIKKLSLDDYIGRWVLLFFYPSDFTFV